MLVKGVVVMQLVSASKFVYNFTLLFTSVEGGDKKYNLDVILIWNQYILLCSKSHHVSVLQWKQIFFIIYRVEFYLTSYIPVACTKLCRLLAALSYSLNYCHR
jgi:hypothetical protein